MATSCESCDTEEDIVFCTGCNDYYCRSCWAKRRSHKDKSQLGPGGIPHDAVEPAVVQIVERCMAGPQNEVDERKQHDEDQDTTWFGLNRDGDGNPILSEYRRYTSIMMESTLDAPTVRYPGLVSFVGQTGAGKSTLIRLLIDAQKQQDQRPQQTPPAAPVIGRAGCEIPTSADVHLYMDPNTFSQSQPILYADCEGFEGGERNPVASGGVYKVPRRPVSQGPSSTVAARHGSNVLDRLVPGTKRALKWARRDAPEYEKTGKRQYAVSEMYPRIFYAFSDVIVFVLNNPKTMEDVMEKLLKWADANYSKSINLPTKPHAIIAINKCNNSTPDVLWNRFTATGELFQSMDTQIQKNETFQSYVKKWKSPYSHITDMESLFRCYYSTVHVIRLPDKSRYQLLADQRDELYNIITECCHKSFTKKQNHRMLPDADEFGLYLSMAFDHFSETLDKPFDYIEASMKYKPPPETMHDNLYIFAKLVADKLGIQGQIKELFNELVDMVASCLLLDSVRKRRFGQPDDWFRAKISSSSSPHDENGALATESGTSYEAACVAAVQEYYNRDVTCSFTIKRNWQTLEGGFRCGKKRLNHGRSHREQRPLSAREEWGNFEYDFPPDTFSWEKQVLERMNGMQTDWDYDNTIDPRLARVIAHSKVLESFYQRLTTRPVIFCNSVCLCCLYNPPDHLLACEHVICFECAKDFGLLNDELQLVVDKCPLHSAKLPNQATQSPTVIDLEPPHSGLRVLTLDGGGVRGIVELCVLKAIENRIGVPLHNFFDLVVGTSTGGIISLGFGHELWSIEQCIEKFKSLVNQAFTSRPGQSLHGLRKVELLVKRSMYETRPLENALQSAFGNGKLFGDRRLLGNRRLKVAVAAVTEAGQKAVVLSNYNISDGPAPSPLKRQLKVEYQRHRPIRPEEELKVWEAARATSAAPGFFKPFSKTVPGNPSYHRYPELLDGALRHNNPICLAMEEARRLAASQDQYIIPDIILSLGTGLPYGSDTRVKGPEWRKRFFIWTIFTMVSFQISLNLNAEERWKTETEPLQRDPLWKDRLYRLNPDLAGQPPKMDDIEKVQSMQQNVTGWTEDCKEISQIACSLVASSFYFKRDGKAMEVHVRNSSLELHGHIKCRLQGKEAELKALGAFLSSCHNDAAFVIEDSAVQDGDHRVEIDVGGLRENGRFEDIPVIINIPSEETSTRIALDMRGIANGRRMFNISGFPRQLMRHDFRAS